MRATPTSYAARSGGPEDDKKPFKVTKAIVGKDGKSVRLKLDSLRAGYVHELHLSGINAKNGTELLHKAAYYTLVNVPE